MVCWGQVLSIPDDAKPAFSGNIYSAPFSRPPAISMQSDILVLFSIGYPVNSGARVRVSYASGANSDGTGAVRYSKASRFGEAFVAALSCISLNSLVNGAFNVVISQGSDTASLRLPMRIASPDSNNLPPDQDRLPTWFLNQIDHSSWASKLPLPKSGRELRCQLVLVTAQRAILRKACMRYNWIIGCGGALLLLSVTLAKGQLSAQSGNPSIVANTSSLACSYADLPSGQRVRDSLGVRELSRLEAPGSKSDPTELPSYFGDVATLTDKTAERYERAAGALSVLLARWNEGFDGKAGNALGLVMDDLKKLGPIETLVIPLARMAEVSAVRERKGRLCNSYPCSC